MKRVLAAIFTLIFLFGLAAPSYAYWVWSPDSGKWVNPKKLSKDTPEEQYAWALELYNNKDWERAIEEFEKLPQMFPTSRLAAEGVYYVGLSWEAKADYAKAADAYQRLIDRYPYSERIKDAIRREFDLAGQFAAGTKVKIGGIPVLVGLEKSVELYKHIVKNAPFGSYGSEAQYNLGEVYKSQGEFELAQKAFQAVVDEYPSSELVSKAKYQIAQCSLLASREAAYNEQSAQRAIDEFENFKNNFPADAQILEADESIKILRAKKADTYLQTALFYERQKKWASAKVYFNEVVNKYSETPAAEKARQRLDAIERGDTSGGFSFPKFPKVKFPKLW